MIGSWKFIIAQSVVLAIWIVLNVIGYVHKWDPYPFILLNLMLSFQAAYAAPIIMMSQNRLEERDRIRAEEDLETDLKAETLIEEIHLHVLDLRLKRWAELLEIQQQQIDMLKDLVDRAALQKIQQQQIDMLKELVDHAAGGAPDGASAAPDANSDPSDRDRSPPLNP